MSILDERTRKDSEKYVQHQGDPKRYKALVKQQLTLFE